MPIEIKELDPDRPHAVCMTARRLEDPRTGKIIGMAYIRLCSDPGCDRVVREMTGPEIIAGLENADLLYCAACLPAGFESLDEWLPFT